MVTLCWLGLVPAAAPRAIGQPAPTLDPGVVVVRIGDEVPEKARAGVEEALRAQLAALPVTVVVGHNHPAPASETERLVEGRALQQEHGAVLVYWVGRPRTDRWAVYAWDTRSEHMVPRAVSIEQGAEQAAIEAVAVIARNAVAAVLASAPAPLEVAEAPVPPIPAPGPPAPVSATTAPAATLEPGTPESARQQEATPGDAPSPQANPPEIPPTPPVAWRDPTPIDLWVALGYRGQNVGDDLPWDNGLALMVAWRAPSGLLLGAEFAGHPPADVGGAATFNIIRFPLAGFIGYRLWADPAYVAVSAAVLLDIQHHSTPPQADLTPEDADTAVRYGLAPGFRMELPMVADGGFFVALDMAIFLNNFKYITIGSRDTVVILDLHPVSARFTTGIWLGI